MSKLFRQLGLPLFLAWLVCGQMLAFGQAKTRPLQLTERTVALSAAIQPSEETVFTLSGFGWFYVGGVVPGSGRSVVQAFDPDGAPQQEYVFPFGQVIHALQVLDDGALWGLTRRDETGWRLVKFNFVGQLLQDVPLVFPKGFELPVPTENARLHMVPGLDHREVHGIYFASGTNAVFKTFSLSTYGVVLRASNEGFRDRDGFTHRVSRKPAADAAVPDGESQGIAWKRSFFLFSEPFYALDIWDDQVIVQTSGDGAHGQSYLLAMNDYRPMWREPLQFPLRNNSYTFYHFNKTTRKVTLYPYLDALMGTGWRVPGKRSAPAVPKKQTL